jgi:hypothetical protein
VLEPQGHGQRKRCPEWWCCRYQPVQEERPWCPVQPVHQPSELPHPRPSSLDCRQLDYELRIVDELRGVGRGMNLWRRFSVRDSGARVSCQYFALLVISNSILSGTAPMSFVGNVEWRLFCLVLVAHGGAIRWIAGDDALFLAWYGYLGHTSYTNHLLAAETTLQFALPNLKIQSPVVFTSGVEGTTALCTATPTGEIFINTQHVLAGAAQYGSLAALRHRPYSRRVGLASVVAGDAGVEAATTRVLDGDDIERRVPVGALGQRGDGEAMDGGSG